MILNIKAISLRLKYILTAFMIFALLSNVYAQDAPIIQQDGQATNNFEDQDLQKFASAAEKVMMIQQETEQKMVQAIEGENLDIEKFNEILRAQQEEGTELTATEEEMQSFNSAAENIIKIQTEVQSDMMRVIQDEGLEPQKYEEILMAYQTDPATKARVDALLHGETQE